MITKKTTHLIKKLCEFMLGKRKNFYIFGNNYPTKDGTAIRDFIHVSDLSNLHILSMNYLISTKKSQIFNCGYGKEYSVLEIVKAALRNSKKLNYKISGRRKGDVGYAVADNSKIKRFLKFKPKYNNINFILNTALKWEKNFTKIDFIRFNLKIFKLVYRKKLIMNIHEHQAKEILKSYGAPVSDGIVIFSLDEIKTKILNLKAKSLYSKLRFMLAEGVRQEGSN